MTAEHADEIRGFILREVLDDPEGDISLQTPLLAGLLDSWGLMQLIYFLEETYDVSIGPDEVVDENFKTIAAVAEFVSSKAPA